MTLHCFKCEQEVVFDAEHIGRNGKKIPLDPDTHAPHKCPMSDYNKEKDDHGNETFNPPNEIEQKGEEDVRNLKIIKDMEERKQQVLKGEYVDHTRQAKLKLKVLTSTEAEGLSLAYNNFGETHNIKFGQYQATGSLYTIAVFYEEIAK